MIHEIGHWMRKRLLSPEELRVVEEDLGITSEVPGKGWSERHEETYARAWERYWMEGKAPTYRLRAIFAKMRQYLINIYQTLKNLKVELSDNLRAHFDRMVATEAERKERPIYELNEDYFVEPADHPLTVKEMDSYDKLASEAYRRARVNVEAQMKREDAKREAGWRKEALELLKDDPVHSGMDEIVKRGGLNEKQLRADYGDETIGSLKAARRGLVSPKGKLVPDEVAADFGFGDLDSMVQAFINSKTKPEAIESIVDSLRSEYAPTKEELAADMHLRLLDEEIKVLKEITESATAKMQNKTARGIKQVIRENTGQIKVDQVNDRGSYPELIAAMKREAAAARTAFNAGKKEAALKAKERQREISQKYRDMVKARNEFQKITKSLNRMLNDKKVNWEYKEALIELIQLTGRTKRQAKLKPGALQEFVDKQEVNGEAIIIDRDFIMRLQEMYYRGQRLGSMSMDDVRLLHDTAKQIHYAGKIHDQFIGEQRKISFQASKLRVIRSIYQNAKTVEVSPDRPLPPSSREKGVAQKFLDGIDAYHSELLMPEMILRALDGFHEMGPVYEEMWLECKAAADAEIRLQEKASKAIDETLALIEDRKAFSTEKHTVKGLPFPMTRLEMVGWYLHSLHPDNRAALAKGFGDPEKKEWLTEEQIDIPGNLLTEREKEIARKIVEELLPILTPHVEKTYLALNGRPMIRVKGVYYPLYFDRKLSDRINEAKTEREAEQAFKDFFPFIGTKFGSTIERKGGKYPPELNFIKVLSQYFNEGTHFATHAVAVRNLLKIINDPDFKRAVTIARGENAYKQLKPWLKEIANPGREPMLKGEALVGYIRRNTTAFIMVGRLSTALIQPTAILSAIPEVGAGWVLKGVSAYLSNPWKWDKFIEERSASIANRSHSYDREMADVGNGDSWKDLYLRWGMYMTAYLDTRTARMAWLSAYTKAMNGRVENIAQGDEGRAIDYADGVTERSQGSASPKNKAAIMRGGELFKTFITFFYTFFNAQYNQIIQAWGKYKSPTLDYGILDLMKDYWFLLTIPGIINELTRGNTPKTPGDIALYPFTSTGKMLLSTIPLVRDASSVFFEGYDYRGGMLGNVGKEIKSLGNAMDMSKTKRDRLKQILIHGAKATGNLTGLPP
ncbi:MAG: hypothetical protein PHI12_14220, partial [Dehalococcoidales bacterium]|nr:hypothetical protein [Dehalococcoidales bacterium]